MKNFEAGAASALSPSPATYDVARSIPPFVHPNAAANGASPSTFSVLRRVTESCSADP